MNLTTAETECLGYGTTEESASGVNKYLNNKIASVNKSCLEQMVNIGDKAVNTILGDQSLDEAEGAVSGVEQISKTF